MVKIYDCFIFFNEVELLKFRIRYLKDIVDYFVIIEASKTFTGNSKPQNFSFDHFDDVERSKIKYFFIDLPDENLNQYLDFNRNYMSQDPVDLNAWAREHYQRNYISKALEEVGAGIDDIILISDVDEIFNIKPLSILKNHSSEIEGQIVSFPTYVFNFNINTVIKDDTDKEVLWYHPVVILHKILKNKSNKVNLVRHSRPDVVVSIKGWHFSYFGTDEKVSYKCNSTCRHTSEPERPLRVENALKAKKGNSTKPRLEDLDLKIKYDLPGLVFDEEFRSFFTGEIE